MLQASSIGVVQAGVGQHVAGGDALLVLASGQRGLGRHTPFDLAAVATEALDTVRPDAARAGVTIQADITSAPMTGSPELVRRLAANLLKRPPPSTPPLARRSGTWPRVTLSERVRLDVAHVSCSERRCETVW